MEKDVKTRANPRQQAPQQADGAQVESPPVPPAEQDAGVQSKAQAAPEAEPQQAPPDLAPQDPELERLQQELGAARRRVDELARAYQALTQDREEFKQRLTRERERMLEVEKGKVAGTLLEAIDELDRCLSASPQDSSALAKGVRLIRESLLSKATATGIERLSLVGKPFDPNLAEAVDMEITPEEDQDQQVVSEITAGYRLKDRVIRPARVKVAKYVKPADA